MNSGRIVERRDQVLIGFLSRVAAATSTFFSRCPSTNGPFFSERDIQDPLLPIPALHDHRVGALVLARAIALGERPPRADRVALGAGAAFAAAVRVVDRVHRDATHRRTHAAPAHRAGLADLAQVVFLVADLADRCTAVDQHAADLARPQPQLRITALARQQLHRGARRARQLRTLARLHLDAMHGRADRDVAQRQRIADPDRRLVAAQQLRADRKPLGRDDVAPLAVEVAQQRQVCGTIRVILEALDLGSDAVLVALEVDDAIMLLVATALVTHRDAPRVVAARATDLLLEQRRERLALVQVRIDDLDDSAPAGRRRFYLDERHLLHLLREVDFLPGLEPHVGLAHVAAAALEAAKFLLLALLVQDLDRVDLSLAQHLDCSLHFQLGCIVHYAERDLLVLLSDHRALLGDDRPEQHSEKTVLAHPHISSSLAIAGFVMITFL